MHVAEYDASLFRTLPTFPEAERNLSRFAHSLRLVGSVVSRHDGEECVGVALLHRHFELNPDERLVERVVPQERLAIAQPRTSRAHTAAMPHLFRATRAEGGYRWHPLEYVDASGEREAMTETLAWFMNHGDLLLEVAEALDENGTLDVFGLSLTHGRELIPARTMRC